jgi:hypothetical protein
MAKDIKDMRVGTKDTDVVEVNVTGDSAVPMTTSGSSAMQQVNPGFEGLDTIASFMPYFILDGSELLNKTDNTVHPNIEVVLTGGKPVWQLWDLSSNLVAESYDGNADVNGRPMNELLQAEKEKVGPSEADKIKIQARYEIYFDWDYADEGTKLTKISLSPASKFAFADYVKDLTKQGLVLEKVITRIGAERTVSKQGFRYSKATFELVGETK